MDISALLSPDRSGESTPQAPSSPRKASRPSHQQQQQQQQVASSPLVNVTTPGEQPAVKAGSVAQGTTEGRTRSTPPASADADQTQSKSASGNPLDNLADLASIQQHQPQRPHQPAGAAPVSAAATAAAVAAANNPPRQRMPSQSETQAQRQGRTPSTMNPNVELVSRSTPRPGLAMASDPPRETVRSDYAGTCLSPDAQQLATRLAAEITQNRHAYDARVQFIRLLHQGLVDHIYPPSSPESRGDPHQYDVMKDLRAAREELDSLFAIGEDLWAEWIQDESLLARTIEERVAVIELCRRSVEEEYGSTKLWIIYGDWMLHLYNAVQAGNDDSAASNSGNPAGAGAAAWSEEDRMVGRETFRWESVMEVWKQAAETTRWHLNDSHLVWNRYLELALQEVSGSPSADNISHLQNLFENRLRTPHMIWDQTFQLFSSFVSTYYNANYEDIMVDMNSKASEAKRTCSDRELRELALQRAAEQNDTTAEYNAFAEYIDWEASRESGGGRNFSFDLAIALYQRAVLRFPTDANLWEDYMMLAIDESSQSDHMSSSVMRALERATRHCPWSGSLWSHHLLTAERVGYSLDGISDIKHKATRTGLLDAAGIDQVLKFHTTWCSFLRRNAFQADATDEDVDIAEVGIRSAIEDVQELGEKNNSPVPIDPAFRLERIYIHYLSESGSWDSARETFKGLIRRHGHSYDFWLAYYSWELICWAKFTQSDGSAGASRRTPCPSYATAVLRQALHRTDLDWPEKIMDTYITHCEHYEDAEELQLAVLDIRRAMKAVTKKREKEALEQQKNQQQQQQQQQQNATAGQPTNQHYVATPADQPTQIAEAGGDAHIGKRKRGDEPEEPGSNKKPRPEEDTVMETTETDQTQVPKRDREHATVLVKNLPRDIPALKVRQFFRDCGTINTLRLLPGETDTSALIEFESKDDAEAALTRDQKPLEGSTISIRTENQTTIFVTNFPPTADEAYIRNLFSSYGDIVDVRFPSLKFNTHRRFCYVQFQTSASAYGATELDKKVVGDKLNLVVKISDPSRREDRSGPVEEGREIHISNLDWKASEDDLVELFTAYGRVEAARIPKKANGGSKGFGFVVFANKDSATAALEMDNQNFRNRPLHVHISSRTGPKRLATTVVSRVSRSRSPSAAEPSANGAEASTPTPTSTNHVATEDMADADIPTTGERDKRTLGLMYVPDTVNDARIRSLAESFGPLVKIVLRPDHQGAIIEFRNVSDAGRAQLALDGKEITPGREIRTGSVQDMLKCPAEKKSDKIRVGKQNQNQNQNQNQKGSGPSTSSASFIRAPIRRPVQPGPSSGRGGKRGGLGFKRAPTQEGTAPAAASAGAGRSNSDFRAMLEGSKAKPTEEAGQEGDAATATTTTATMADGEKKE